MGDARKRANFALGVNYWPGNRAMSWWSRFDAGDVAADFARIRAAGFGSVRLFLLWEDFQPAPDQVSATALQRLVEVADVAAQNGLLLVPTLFTGHMSGANWIPAWALAAAGPAERFPVVSGGHVTSQRLADWYTDDAVQRAQAFLAYEAATALRGHTAVWAWDLGNENSNCVVPPARAAAIDWLDRIAGALRSADPSLRITMGLHQEDLSEDRRLGPREAARVCDFLSMHGYPLYADWAESPTDPFVLPFLGLITRWLGGKDVLFAEFGAPTRPPDGSSMVAGDYTLLEEETAAQFTGQALEALHRFGFLGAMLWCYSDYDPALWGEPPLNTAPHERYFGLWRARPAAAPKPSLDAIKPWADVPRLAPMGDFSWVGMAWEDYYRSPRENLQKLYRRFRARFAANAPA